MWLRLLLFIGLIYVGVKAFRWVNKYLKSRTWQREIEPPAHDSYVSDMVRDPVCGIFIPANEAVTVVKNGRTVHFCSRECRKRFVDAHG